MSQLSVSSSEMQSGKRQSKLTAKALCNKIENLQNERKKSVNKMKQLIPQMKSLMKKRENVSQVQSLVEDLIEQYGNATKLHDMLIPLLPEEEQEKQSGWFSSIKDYSIKFQKVVEQWLNEPEEHLVMYEQLDPGGFNEQVFVPTPEGTQQQADPINTDEFQDNIKPSDSVSNVGEKVSKSQCSGSGRMSVASSISSARLKVEADLAALKMRQKLLKEKHELEEEEQRLHKRKEQLKLDEEIAANLAKLSVFQSRSVTSGKTFASKCSDGMNSYLEKGQNTLSAKAKTFVPESIQNPQSQIMCEHLDTGTKPKGDHAINFNASKFKSSAYYVPDQHSLPMHGTTHTCNMELPQANAESQCGDQINMLNIMRKQNEMFTLLIHQQSLVSLPKREIPVFDGDPLKYHAFMKAFENGVENVTSCYSDRLYFLEQFTKGYPKQLVSSCQHGDPQRGYIKAKALLKENFGNEQKVAHAYISKVLSWPSIKTEDVKALQEYSLFLRGCSNAMEEVQYLHELDMPANMLTVIKKLPYKFRDKWRSVACELQERHNQRVKFTDITSFVEKQVKILTDPVFGNIQDVSPQVPNQVISKSISQSHSGIKGTSFATTVSPVNNSTQLEVNRNEHAPTTKKACLYCEGGHTLDSCSQLDKKAHKDKMDFLRKNGVCFGCLCIGHVSKCCRKRSSCGKCGLRHPTLLHIPLKDTDKTFKQAEKRPEVSVDSTLISSGLTGAGEHDCKLPIVPVQVKSKKGSKIINTYAFLDPGSTAVFCTEAVMHQLNLTGMKVQILLKTMGQEKVVSSHVVQGLEVAGLNGEQFCELPKAYTQLSMPVHKRNIPKQADLQRWPHLRHVHLPEIDAEIGLLIGTNVPTALEPLQVIPSINNGPYAIRTLLGWTVNGPLRGDNGNAMDNELPQVSVNRVSVVDLDELWLKQFRMDFPERSMDEQPGMSKEDNKFMELVSNSVKLVDGHYQINLPLRNMDINMPNNRRIVEQRALYLKKRLQKDSSFNTDYMAFMNDLLAKGYAERVPEEDLERNDGKVWYPPHHGVYHPTKRKLRVVFDCGASFQGTSLNAQLLQGPDLTSSLRRRAAVWTDQFLKSATGG